MKSILQRIVPYARNVAVISLVVMIFYLSFEAYSQKLNLVKPLIVIRDANRPSLSFDGSRIVAGPEIGVAVAFDVDSQRRLGTYRVLNAESAAISDDGKLIRIFGGGRYTTLEVLTGNLVSEGEISILKRGKKVASVGIANNGGMTSRTITSDLEIASNIYPWWGDTALDQPAVIVGRLRDQSLVSELRPPDGFVHGDIWSKNALTPDGKIVAASRYNNSVTSRALTAVWDVSSGKVILSLPLHSSWLSLSDDGKRLVREESRDGGKIQVWDLLTGKEISTIKLFAYGRPVVVSAGVLSPNGKVLVTTRNTDFHFWDTDTGKFLTSQKQDNISEGNVESVIFSGNGKRIAIGSDTEVVTVWSVDEILKTIKTAK